MRVLRRGECGHLLLAAPTPRRIPGAAPARHAALPLFSPSFFLSLARSPLPPVHACEPRARPPSIAAIPRRPSLHRQAGKLCLILLLFLVEGIELERPEKPPPSPIPSPDLRATVVDSAAAGHPSATSTPPAALG
jgi:hypothetical protein